MIDSFKIIAIKTYMAYQPSGMATSKANPLHHFVQDLRDVGGVEGVHEGLYEGTHELFKNEFNRSSKSTGKEMNEVIQKQGEIYYLQLGDKKFRTRPRVNVAPVIAFHDGWTYLVQSGVWTTFVVLGQVGVTYMANSLTYEALTTVSDHIIVIITVLSDDEM